MKKFIFLLALFTFLPIRAWADQELTGDTKLACEAILCLSSGTRPGECGPSLSRYFGISHKKWKDTVKSRRNFLNQCPTVGEDPSMPTLVEAILNGAGRCTADLLNRQLRKQVPVEECIPDDIWRRMSREDREIPRAAAPNGSGSLMTPCPPTAGPTLAMSTHGRSASTTLANGSTVATGLMSSHKGRS